MDSGCWRPSPLRNSRQKMQLRSISMTGASMRRNLATASFLFQQPFILSALPWRLVMSRLLFVIFFCASLFGGEAGIVSLVKIVSDKVPDVSSMEAWKKSYITDGMTDEQKALAVWKTVATFQHQDACVNEYMQNEDSVQD